MGHIGATDPPRVDVAALADTLEELGQNAWMVDKSLGECIKEQARDLQ